MSPILRACRLLACSLSPPTPPPPLTLCMQRGHVQLRSGGTPFAPPPVSVCSSVCLRSWMGLLTPARGSHWHGVAMDIESILCVIWLTLTDRARAREHTPAPAAAAASSSRTAVHHVSNPKTRRTNEKSTGSLSATAQAHTHPLSRVVRECPQVSSSSSAPTHPPPYFATLSSRGGRVGVCVCVRVCDGMRRQLRPCLLPSLPLRA